ncbi:hypothetical protein V6N13_143642 [Hibiscus sabdariffa]
MIRSNVSTGNYEATEDSQPAVLKQDASEATQGSHYTVPSSAYGYNYENSQQLNPAFIHPQTNTQIENLTPFSSVMVSFSRKTLLFCLNVALVSGVPSYHNDFCCTKHIQIHCQQFADINCSDCKRAGSFKFSLPRESMPTKYTNAVSSISGPAISMPELSRVTLTCTSAFQQAFAGDSNYPQSLAAVLPQYKNSVYMSSLPLSAAVASGYGLQNSTNVPGGFL